MVGHRPSHVLCIELPAQGALGGILIVVVMVNHRLDDGIHFVGIPGGIRDQDRVGIVRQLAGVVLVDFRADGRVYFIVNRRCGHDPLPTSFVAMR